MKKFDYNFGLLISLVISSLVDAARIFILNNIDLAYLGFHFLYVFIITYIYWLVCQYFIFQKKNQSVKIIFYLLLSGTLSLLYHLLLQYYFKEVFKLYNDYPIIENLTENKQQATLFIRGIIYGVLIYFILFYLNLISEKQKSRVEIEQLKKEKLEVQLNSLRQQISPHFLFNSLSTLKNIVEDESSKKYIVQLSNVYRYLLNFNEDHLVTISEELEFIQSYLYILKERFEDALEVKFTINKEALQMRIPPLSLQLLIENAVKHNIVSLDNPLRIAITTIDNHSISVSNNLQLKYRVENGSKIGLENIKTRYNLLSDKELVIINDSVKFEVILPLLD